jgi:hypothetical protein
MENPFSPMLPTGKTERRFSYPVVREISDWLLDRSHIWYV